MYGTGFDPGLFSVENDGGRHWRSIEVTNRGSRAPAADALVEPSDPLAKAKIVVLIQ
jgi:hypothetical protein